ncbi:hypothetical protein EGW08_009380, partial [Elysia chlorotica]
EFLVCLPSRRGFRRAGVFPVLLAACGPGGEHGRVDRQRGLAEILVLQRRLGTHALGGVVREEPGQSDRDGENRQIKARVCQVGTEPVADHVVGVLVELDFLHARQLRDPRPDLLSRGSQVL